VSDIAQTAAQSVLWSAGQTDTISRLSKTLPAALLRLFMHLD